MITIMKYTDSKYRGLFKSNFKYIAFIKLIGPSVKYFQMIYSY